LVLHTLRKFRYKVDAMMATVMSNYIFIDSNECEPIISELCIDI
jgi:hypothetical protein